MKWLSAMVVACVLLATSAHAQVTATYDMGRNFSVAEGSFVLSHVIGLEGTRGPVTASAAVYVARGGVFEKDLTLAVAKERGKWTFTSYVGTYWYSFIGRDWSWSVGVRRVIR